jgi:hypothetical protein
MNLIPIKLKVWLIKHLYADIAAMGDGGDTALAHVNLTEIALLKAHGGAGTINPRTGLVEFKGGKGGGLLLLKQHPILLTYLNMLNLSMKS